MRSSFPRPARTAATRMAEVTAALTVDGHVLAYGPADCSSPESGAKAWPFPSMKGWTEYHPLGVAGVISPWNYPFYLSPCSPRSRRSAPAVRSCLSPRRSLRTVRSTPRRPRPRRPTFRTDVVIVIHGYGDTGAALVGSQHRRESRSRERFRDRQEDRGAELSDDAQAGDPRTRRQGRHDRARRMPTSATPLRLPPRSAPSTPARRVWPSRGCTSLDEVYHEFIAPAADQAHGKPSTVATGRPLGHRPDRHRRAQIKIIEDARRQMPQAEGCHDRSPAATASTPSTAVYYEPTLDRRTSITRRI